MSKGERAGRALYTLIILIYIHYNTHKHTFFHTFREHATDTMLDMLLIPTRDIAYLLQYLRQAMHI